MRPITFRNRDAAWPPLAALGVLLLFGGAPSLGESNEAASAWGEPSGSEDAKISAWAAQQFAKPNSLRETSDRAPEQVAADGVNPIRTQPTRQPAPFTPPESGVAPVRYEQEDASPNPLRTATQKTSAPEENSAARQAFTGPPAPPIDSTPVQRPSAPNPFVRLDAQSNTPASQVSSPSTEPREFVPVSSAPDATPQSTIPPASPLEKLAPVEPAPPAIAPGAERSIIASRSSVVRPLDKPQEQAPAAPAIDSVVQEPTFRSSPTLSPIREGTGRPGGHELEGAQRASLVMEKRGPAEARIGQPCRFVLKVRNTGQRMAENVVLRDETPVGARLVETIPPAQHDGAQLSWRLGSLAPGEERSVEVHVEPLSEGQIGSVATVTFDAQASAVTKCTRPEIAVRLSAPGKVLVGQKQPLRIEVHNPGTGVATGVMLVEDVPSNLRHEAGPELEFEVGSLAPGETRRIDLMLAAESAGHVVNRISAVADGGLRVEQSIEFDVVAPSLAVEVEGPGRRYLERPASYTVSIGNPGTAPAKDVRLVTHLPRGLKFVRANNLGEYDAETHSIYWSLAELPEGEHGAVELVALPVAAGEHTLVVEGVARDGLKASESQRVLVEGVASLAFDIRDLQDPIEVGGQAAYDVVVTNEGTQAASNVRVVIEAPPGMRVAEARGQTEHRLGEGRVEFAPIPRLEPGVKTRFAVRMIGQQPGDQRVAVEVQSDELTQPIRREESTRVFGDE